MPRLRQLLLAALVAGALCSGTASAHKLKVFATGEGETIGGYVYFPGGGRAQGLTVIALAPDGSAAGQAITNAEGQFTISVAQRADFMLVAESRDGHRAEFLVPAEELSAGLPQTRANARKTPAEVVASASRTDDLEALVQRAVREQIRPLREQIEAYEEEVRFRDVVGGIGYIAGLAGIAFYFLGGRRRAPEPGER